MRYVLKGAFAHGLCVTGVVALLLAGLMTMLAPGPVRAEGEVARAAIGQGAVMRPPRILPDRPAQIPVARWDHVRGAQRWTQAALFALQSHGRALVDITPRDIKDWCPAYPQAAPAQRRAFWVGFLSTLAKHESTYRPHAVGGGGLWYGLTQILPATARGYGCQARSGEALKSGPANLSCAIRIMARTVTRDGVVSRLSPSVARIRSSCAPIFACRSAS
jgi:hypothetical protein